MEHFVWNADPILFSFGAFSIHWYGFLFALAIISGFQVMNFIYKYEKKPIEQLDSLQIYIVIGIVVGARLGHCLFYDPAYYLSNPLEILAIHKGGLASHGGGVGAILATLYYAKKSKVNFLYLLDRLAIPTALFAFFVRVGNLMNSEIVGIQTDVAWGVIFPRVDFLVRHPVQVYEALTYLIVFFVLSAIYLYTKKKENAGFIFGIFLLSVFSARFMIEFVKVHQAAYDSILNLNTGQMLSIPFLLLSLWLIKNSVKTKG
ncbi:prolipoprotein diacylglyceryl transferase [Sulfurimonas sp.]